MRLHSVQGARSSLYGLAALRATSAAALFLSSCAITPAPTDVRFTSSVDERDPFTVHLTTQAKSSIGELTYRWNFGDGTDATCAECKIGPDTFHHYQRKGYYPVTLTVTDRNLASADSTAQVLAGNLKPKARLTVPPDATLGGSALLDGSNSVDPDGTVERWRFDFGDGTPPVEGDQPTIRHTYPRVGTFTATLTVFDNDAAESAFPDQKDIRVVVRPDNEAPRVSVVFPDPGPLPPGTVTLRAQATDNVGVDAVTFYVDGRPVGTVKAQPYNLDWDSRTVEDGTHMLTAKAFDAANNVGESAVVTIQTRNQ